MAERTIRTSGATGVTIEPILTAVLAGDLLMPSPELWLVSPWIGDVPALDNSRGEFDAMFPDDPVTRVYPLSYVLARLTHEGTRVIVVTRPDDFNTTFLSNFGREAESARCAVIPAEDLHEKTLCGQDWLLTGSMNFTVRGLRRNDEAVTYRTDPRAAAKARMDFRDRWRGLP